MGCFHSPNPWHHAVAHAIFSTNLHSFDGPIAMEEQRPSLGNTYAADHQSSSVFRTIVLKNGSKTALLNTKLAIERGRRLETQRTLFAVMRLWSPVVLK